MNSNHPEITPIEKYKIVLANREKFNAIENKTISELQSCCQKSQLPFFRSIQLQTYYKCCRPALESITWDEEVNYKVAYPVGGVVAFKQNQEKYYSVDVKVATWIQSGGVRLMPIKASLSKQKIKEHLQSTHALFIPEYEGLPQVQFFTTIADFIKENVDYPVLSLGNSAIMMLSIINSCEQIIKKARMDLKFHNSQMMVFASHEDRLFHDLDLKTRLQIQNRARVLSSSVHLPVDLLHLCKDQNIELICFGKGRMEEWGVVVARQHLTHYCFLDPRQSGNNRDHVNFSHKLIVNFMQEVRRRDKIIQQKGIELGQYKVVLKDDRYFYNIDTKLPKV